MIKDYLTAFLNGYYENDFRERELIATKLDNRMKNLNKKIKKMQFKSKENLKRWFK